MTEKPLTEDDIRATVQVAIDKGILPKYGMPETITLVEQIAKTSVGKLNKKQMRQDLAAIYCKLPRANSWDGVA